MVFKLDFRDGEVLEWHVTSNGTRLDRTTDYTPSLYVAGARTALDDLAERLGSDPTVARIEPEEWYLDLHARERSRVRRVDVERIEAVTTLAHEIRHHYGADHAPGTFRLYNVDLSPQFRYCIETGTPPTHDRALETLRLDLPESALVEGDLTALKVDGHTIGETPEDVLHLLQARLDNRDPDVLICSSAQLVEVLSEEATEYGVDRFRLGRRPGWTQLAGASTYESYGRVGHSPARYNVPGRAIIDTSNSFLWSKAGLPGLLDLVERSWKPLQETAWGSIGTILTAIQIRKALDRDVLAPWNKWEAEAFKSVETLHAADRGGFTFEPKVGLHEDVVEVDFASLYPNIMCQYNVSPETVDCDCHADREDVPGLGYSICDRPGFLGDVLQPIIDDRADIKERLTTTDDPEEQARLEAQSDALKWILVSCFGYQGYRNSKFGRIEAHEAINAYAREILLDAKEVLEANGWEVVHGIVDSLWVREREDAVSEPLTDLASEISSRVGIRLEVENAFEWVAFVPQRDSNAGALTKYFGKIADADAFKLRGIEARQRSTPPFVEDVQRDLIRVLDRERDPEAVCDRLQRALGRLRSGRVDPAELVVQTRASKRLEAYSQANLTVAALQRAREHGLERVPGQDVRYVVVDDDARTRNRVRLDLEDIEAYDAEFYAERLRRATESVLSSLGWDRARIERYLRETRTVGLGAFE